MEAVGLMIVSAIMIIFGGAYVKAKLTPVQFIKYLKATPKASGGIKVVVVVVLILVLLASSIGCSNLPLKKLQYTEVYAGIEWTGQPSSACEKGGLDDKGTSNVGVNQHILSTLDDTWTLEGYYRHHSCFINEDRESWDSLGLQSKYKLYWDRVWRKFNGR